MNKRSSLQYVPAKRENRAVPKSRISGDGTWVQVLTCPLTRCVTFAGHITSVCLGFHIPK